MGANGHQPWKLRVQIPENHLEDRDELFRWLREWLIPACLNSPVRVTLVLEPPLGDTDEPDDSTE